MDGIYDVLIEAGLTPEQIDQLMGLGVLAGEAGSIIPRQQEYAQELRGARRPRGRQVGNVYTAAHPLEFLGSGLQGVAGHYGEWKARDRQEEILKEQAELRSEFLRKLRGQRQQPMSLPQQPPAQPTTSFAVNLPQGTPYDQWQPYIGPQPLNTRR